MSDKSAIEWTDATWQVASGCTPVSPGCLNCYSARLAGTRMKEHPRCQGLTRQDQAGRHVWTGEVRLHPDQLDQPLRWRRPRRIFVGDRTDLFHPKISDGFIDRVFAVMGLCPQHTFQVLTKRPERMRDYMRREDEFGRHPSKAVTALISATGRWNAPAVKMAEWPLPNVWLGVTAEDQQRADERIPHLLATPAAVRFVSIEPLLGPVDLRNLRRYNPKGQPWIDALQGLVTRGQYLARSPRECGFNISVQIPGELPRLDWVIVGGESGPHARPVHPDWVRPLRDQCADAEVPFLFKQWGEWLPMGQAGFHAWSAQNVRNNGVGKRWLGHAHFNAGGKVPATRSIGPVETTMLHAMSVGEVAVRIGKRAAGRLLDGIEHNGMPEVRHD